MEALSFFETSVSVNRLTRRNIPEDFELSTAVFVVYCPENYVDSSNVISETHK